jgi:N-carbamoyl-L-amino-acid hydrolase
MQRITALADIGSTGDGGCCRLALTEEDRVGRDLVVSG